MVGELVVGGGGCGFIRVGNVQRQITLLHAEATGTVEVLLGEGEGAIARVSMFVLIHRHHVALRVAHVVGRHKFVRAVGRVLVGDLLGDALAHGVVVEVELRLVALLGADHVGDLAGHRPFVA